LLDGEAEIQTVMRRLIGFLAAVSTTWMLACGSEPFDGTPLERGAGEPVEEPAESEVTAEPEPEAPPPAPVAPAPVLCDEQKTSYEPQRPKSNILFAVDRSGSMQIKLPTGSTRWAATRTALFKMLDGLPKMNVRASVMQFPQGDATVNSCCSINAANEVSCNCTAYPAPTKRCDPATYKADAPMDLDATRIQSIKQSINASNTSFYWGTPLAAAETAAVNLQKASKNDGIKSIVLLTDGAPTSCETAANPTANDGKFVVAAAKAGMDSPDKIRTFVIGVVDGANGNDARPDVVSKVAEAGGTARSANCAANNTCFFSVSTAQLEKELGAALDRIAREATDCTFDLPAPGENHDVEKVNVAISTQAGAETVPRDTTQKEGWDYSADKKRIKLYGKACGTLQADAAAKVNVLLGCKTVTTP
jgi:Mg-chelatase subunit ChlD